jgi:hypothetical protein
MPYLKRWGSFAIAFLAGMMVTAFIKWPPAQSSDWAAWVQAFGSIGAIGVAIYVSWAQARNDRLRERERENADADDVLMNIQAIIENASYVMGEMPDIASTDGAIESYFRSSFSPIKIRCATQALAAIEIHRLKWYKAIELVLEMREFFSNADQAVMALNSAFANRSIGQSYQMQLDRITRCKASAVDVVNEISNLRETVRSFNSKSV